MPACKECLDKGTLGKVCPHYNGPEVYYILTDLIAELRDTADVKPGATGRLLREMAGSAEARLREVGRS